MFKEIYHAKKAVKHSNVFLKTLKSENEFKMKYHTHSWKIEKVPPESDIIW